MEVDFNQYVNSNTLGLNNLYIYGKASKLFTEKAKYYKLDFI